MSVNRKGTCGYTSVTKHTYADKFHRELLRQKMKPKANLVTCLTYTIVSATQTPNLTNILTELAPLIHSDLTTDTEIVTTRLWLLAAPSRKVSHHSGWVIHGQDISGTAVIQTY
jgi:hypothetical protein